MKTTPAPRWEWRTFGTSLGAADDVAGGPGRSTAGSTEVSEEVYFLAADSDTVADNAKVRDGMLDIKVLRQADRRGLEQWEPVLKAPFPLEGRSITQLLDALRVPSPTLPRARYSLVQLLAEIVQPSGAIRVVSVHKHRQRYTIDGCRSELSDIWANGRHTCTLAIEDEDPATVIRVVTGLGLRDHVNTSMPRGLSDLVGGEPTRYAAIDVGTNSVKLHIAERADGRAWRRVVDRAEVTRLGEGLAGSGEIGRVPLDRTVAAIAAMADECRRNHVRAIAAVGTAALRTARNRGEVLDAIDEATGVVVEPISGPEESRLAYVAVRAELGLPDVSLVVFDTGGGSSQFTFGHGAEVSERFSVDVGAARYTERFGLANAVSGSTLDRALEQIGADLHRLDERPAPDVLVGMGGAVTNITAVALELDAYDPDAVHGAVLDRSEIDRQVERYASLDAAHRHKIVGLQPKRAEVILAGACIVRTIMDKLGHDTVTVSDRGLRHGLIAERYGS